MLSTLGSGDLLAEKTGATPATVVALHGWARSGADFTAIVDGLDAVSPHLWGFGITTAPAEAWGSEQYADALAQALEGSAPVIVVGHSFGGRVAVHLAQKYPHLVAGLVLTGVPLVRLKAAPKPALGFRVVRSLAKAGVVPKSVLENQRRKHGSTDYLAAQGVMRDILVRVVGENYDEQLAAIRVPVRMVWGENDTSAPADAGAAASERIAGSTFRVVPGAGHLLDGDLRTAVRSELLALIDEVSA
jgi:pimeloyl-ACP methyl ester carboxylesterase